MGQILLSLPVLEEISEVLNRENKKTVCDDTITSAFILDLANVSEQYRKDFRIDLYAEDPSAIVGDVPYVRRNVVVMANYKYEFSPKMQLNLNPVPKPADEQEPPQNQPASAKKLVGESA